MDGNKLINWRHQRKIPILAKQETYDRELLFYPSTMQSNHEKLLPICRNLNNYIIKLTTTTLKRHELSFTKFPDSWYQISVPEKDLLHIPLKSCVNSARKSWWSEKRKAISQKRPCMPLCPCWNNFHWWTNSTNTSPWISTHSVGAKRIRHKLTLKK